MTKNIINFLILIGLSVSFSGCDNIITEQNLQENSLLSLDKIPCNDINIQAHRTTGNIVNKDVSVFSNINMTRATSNSDLGNKDISTEKFVILPEYLSKIWVGNAIFKSSLLNNTFKPVAGKKKAITLLTNEPNSTPLLVTSPSYSQFNQYVKSQLSQCSLEQSHEYYYSVEQFTSYDELKVAIGNNYDTNFLFWGKHESFNSSEHKISKSTGLYVRFAQELFTVTMEPESLPYVDAAAGDIDSTVYINSVSYGRFGLLSIETNEQAEYSKELITKCCDKLFKHKSSIFTSEEESFLNSCEFKLLLVGGNGTTAIESFSGYNGFVDHLGDINSTKSKTVAPIYCTFQNLRDNSPYSFHYNLTYYKDPIYIDILDYVKDWSHKYVIYFYSNKQRQPTIASPLVSFNFMYNRKYDEVNRNFKDTTFVMSYHNTSLDKKLDACSFRTDFPIMRPSGMPHGYLEHDEVNRMHESATLMDNIDYKLLKIWTIKEGVIPDSIAFLFNTENTETTNKDFGGHFGEGGHFGGSSHFGGSRHFGEGGHFGGSSHFGGSRHFGEGGHFGEGRRSWGRDSSKINDSLDNISRGSHFGGRR